MKRNKIWFNTGLALLVSLLFAANSAQARMSKDEAAYVAEIEQRVTAQQKQLDRYERQWNTIQQMYLQIQRLEEQNQILQGRLEEMAHQIERMKKQQRELYLDVDERLQSLEGGNAVGSDLGAAATGGELTSDTVNSGLSADAGLTAQPQENANEVYAKAFDKLKGGLYPEAIDGFKRFLTRFPDSDLADNAQYWLAEAYYGDRNYQKAIDEFYAVTSKYPDSNKVPDARLKLAYSYYSLKQWEKARKVLQELIQDYPGSSVATLAEDRLKRIELEGH